MSHSDGSCTKSSNGYCPPPNFESGQRCSKPVVFHGSSELIPPHTLAPRFIEVLHLGEALEVVIRGHQRSPALSASGIHEGISERKVAL